MPRIFVPFVVLVLFDLDSPSCYFATHSLAHRSSAFSARKVTPAAIPASACATRYTHSVGHANMPITAARGETAGLNAPPEIAPTANAPATPVNPIARP